MTSENFINRTEAELTRTGESSSCIEWAVPSGETLRYVDPAYSSSLWDRCEGDSIKVWFVEMSDGIQVLRIEDEDGFELVPHAGESIDCLSAELEKRSDDIDDGELMFDGSMLETFDTTAVIGQFA